MTRKPRTHVRRWFSATLDRATNILEPVRGCRTVKVDEVGSQISETRGPNRRLVLNVGDQAILFGPDSEIQSATIEHVDLDGYRERWRVKLGYGALSPSTRVVQVLAGMKAR